MARKHVILDCVPMFFTQCASVGTVTIYIAGLLAVYFVNPFHHVAYYTE